MCIEECGTCRGVWCGERSVVCVGECGVYRGVWCA